MSCRKPYQGINFVIAHDGFTLYDLVAYNSKHNDANGEQNRDGSNDNFSWNCGQEGETGDEGVNALRQRQMRNMMLALMVSQGTPMVLMGELLAAILHIVLSRRPFLGHLMWHLVAPQGARTCMQPWKLAMLLHMSTSHRKTRFCTFTWCNQVSPVLQSCKWCEVTCVIIV